LEGLQAGGFAVAIHQPVKVGDRRIEDRLCRTDAPMQRLQSLREIERVFLLQGFNVVLHVRCSLVSQKKIPGLFTSVWK